MAGPDFEEAAGRTRGHAYRHRAIWTGALGAFSIAYVWFHLLFRDAYLRGLGRPAGEIAVAHTVYEAVILQLAGNLVTAYVLAFVFRKFAVTRISEGVVLTLILWTGLVAALAIPSMIASAFPLYFLAICGGGVLAQLLAMAVVIAVWRIR